MEAPAISKLSELAAHRLQSGLFPRLPALLPSNSTLRSSAIGFLGVTDFLGLQQSTIPIFQTYGPRYFPTFGISEFPTLTLPSEHEFPNAWHPDYHDAQGAHRPHNSRTSGASKSRGFYDFTAPGLPGISWLPGHPGISWLPRLSWI